ncbi:MAG: hypothetical protein IT370_27460 [Deltaproteobacteria bacterium]|nr:hypothetical protein [Deltaproteobacteria bacterium]
MVVIDEHRTLIHTRFVTDGERLLERDVHTIERELELTLRARQLWAASLRVEPAASEGGVVLVLNCQPASTDLEIVRARLAEVLEPIPRRPGAPRITVAPRGPYR